MFLFQYKKRIVGSLRFMSWAETFNSGSFGNSLSNKMANIKLDTTVDTAEIQAKIKKDFNLQNADNNAVQNIQASSSQTEKDNLNFQKANSEQTFVPYQPQAPVINNQTGYNYQMYPMNYGAQQTGYIPIQSVYSAGTTYQNPTTNPITMQTPSADIQRAYQNNSLPMQTTGNNLNVNAY